MWGNKERVLILAPHTDDGEFGCGGSIARFLEMGHEVFYIAFSAAEASLPPDVPSDTLRREVREALKVMEVPESNLVILNYPVREFPQHRQDILQDMINFGKEIRPSMVMMPSTHDTHQDHQVVAAEGFRAFKKITLLGYELPWNNLSFTTNVFVRLEERHLQKKIAAISCYSSQQGRSYASGDFLRSLAKIRGTQIGLEFAESFETLREVI